MPALPPSTNVKQVYSAFMNYVLEHAISYLHDQDGIDVPFTQGFLILSHPNGWGEAEQNVLREAAMATRVLRGQNVQIHFVTEAESIVRSTLEEPDRFHPPLRVGTGSF